ncbi:MAG: hypothetical protein SF182_12770 [Deltaproteobacteria bacterium]|nr:hypothetical protein [Deltaproteobacteria bacterium]
MVLALPTALGGAAAPPADTRSAGYLGAGFDRIIRACADRRPLSVEF